METNNSNIVDDKVQNVMKSEASLPEDEFLIRLLEQVEDKISSIYTDIIPGFERQLNDDPTLKQKVDNILGHGNSLASFVSCEVVNNYLDDTALRHKVFDTLGYGSSLT